MASHEGKIGDFFPNHPNVPDKGAKMMLELINEAFEKREITDEMIWRYSLTKTT